MTPIVRLRVTKTARAVFLEQGKTETGICTVERSTEIRSKTEYCSYETEVSEAEGSNV